MLERLRNYLIWRTKILNGGFLFCKKLLKAKEESDNETVYAALSSAKA